MDKLEITKMLTLSTGHIDIDSADYLDSKDNSLVVYNKGHKGEEYGWFICICTSTIEEDLEDVPEPLENVIRFAISLDCAWLCLDRDGDFISYLPTYEW